MKRKLLLIAILASTLSIATAQSLNSTVLPKTSNLAETTTPAQIASWSLCVNYILEHSSRYDAATLDRLKNDVTSGVVTWNVSAGVNAKSSFATFSGNGLGWYDEEMVVEFPDSQSLNTAVNLMVFATITYANQADPGQGTQSLQSQLFANPISVN